MKQSNSLARKISRSTLVLFALAGVVFGSAHCSREKTFTSSVEILRYAPVRTDASGKTIVADVAIRYSDCPGNQQEVVRGGAEFAACMANQKVSSKVPVSLNWYKDKNGYHSWDVTEIAGCKRPPDPNDLGSFETVQECEDVAVHGVVTGFRCKKLPEKQLVAKCPWFQR